MAVKLEFIINLPWSQEKIILGSPICPSWSTSNLPRIFDKYYHKLPIYLSLKSHEDHHKNKELLWESKIVNIWS